MSRTTRWCGAIVIGAMAVSVAACSSAPDASKPVPTAIASTASASPSPAEQAVLDAYDGFMKAYVATYDSKAPAVVGGNLTLFGGPGHGGLDTDLGRAQTARVNATGTPSWTPPAVTIDTPHGQATATNCFDPATWKTVRMSTQQATKPPTGSPVDKPRPAYPGDAPSKYTSVATLAQNGSGKWFVFAIVAHRSQSC